MEQMLLQHLSSIEISNYRLILKAHPKYLSKYAFEITTLVQQFQSMIQLTQVIDFTLAPNNIILIGEFFYNNQCKSIQNLYIGPFNPSIVQFLIKLSLRNVGLQNKQQNVTPFTFKLRPFFNNHFKFTHKQSNNLSLSKCYPNNMRPTQDKQDKKERNFRNNLLRRDQNNTSRANYHSTKCYCCSHRQDFQQESPSQEARFIKSRPNHQEQFFNPNKMYKRNKLNHFSEFAQRKGQNRTVAHSISKALSNQKRMQSPLIKFSHHIKTKISNKESLQNSNDQANQSTQQFLLNKKNQHPSSTPSLNACQAQNFMKTRRSKDFHIRSPTAQDKLITLHKKSKIKREKQNKSAQRGLSSSNIPFDSRNQLIFKKHQFQVRNNYFKDHESFQLQDQFTNLKFPEINRQANEANSNKNIEVIQRFSQIEAPTINKEMCSDNHILLEEQKPQSTSYSKNQTKYRGSKALAKVQRNKVDHIITFASSSLNRSNKDQSVPQIFKIPLGLPDKCKEPTNKEKINQVITNRIKKVPKTQQKQLVKHINQKSKVLIRKIESKQKNSSLTNNKVSKIINQELPAQNVEKVDQLQIKFQTVEILCKSGDETKRANRDQNACNCADGRLQTQKKKKIQQTQNNAQIQNCNLQFQQLQKQSYRLKINTPMKQQSISPEIQSLQCLQNTEIPSLVFFKQFVIDPNGMQKSSRSSIRIRDEHKQQKAQSIQQDRLYQDSPQMLKNKEQSFTVKQKKHNKDVSQERAKEDQPSHNLQSIQVIFKQEKVGEKGQIFDSLIERLIQAAAGFKYQNIQHSPLQENHFSSPQTKENLQQNKIKQNVFIERKDQVVGQKLQSPRLSQCLNEPQIERNSQQSFKNSNIFTSNRLLPKIDLLNTHLKEQKQQSRIFTQSVKTKRVQMQLSNQQTGKKIQDRVKPDTFEKQQNQSNKLFNYLQTTPKHTKVLTVQEVKTESGLQSEVSNLNPQQLQCTEAIQSSLQSSQKKQNKAIVESHQSSHYNKKMLESSSLLQHQITQSKDQHPDVDLIKINRQESQIHIQNTEECQKNKVLCVEMTPEDKLEKLQISKQNSRQEHKNLIQNEQSSTGTQKKQLYINQKVHLKEKEKFQENLNKQDRYELQVCVQSKTPFQPESHAICDTQIEEKISQMSQNEYKITVQTQNLHKFKQSQNTDLLKVKQQYKISDCEQHSSQRLKFDRPVSQSKQPSSNHFFCNTFHSEQIPICEVTSKEDQNTKQITQEVDLEVRQSRLKQKNEVEVEKSEDQYLVQKQSQLDKRLKVALSVQPADTLQNNQSTRFSKLKGGTLFIQQPAGDTYQMGNLKLSSKQQIPKLQITRQEPQQIQKSVCIVEPQEKKDQNLLKQKQRQLNSKTLLIEENQRQQILQSAQTHLNKMQKEKIGVEVQRVERKSKDAKTDLTIQNIYSQKQILRTYQKQRVANQLVQQQTSKDLQTNLKMQQAAQSSPPLAFNLKDFRTVSLQTDELLKDTSFQPILRKTLQHQSIALQNQIKSQNYLMFNNKLKRKSKLVFCQPQFTSINTNRSQEDNIKLSSIKNQEIQNHHQNRLSSTFVRSLKKIQNVRPRQDCEKVRLQKVEGDVDMKLSDFQKQKDIQNNQQSHRKLLENVKEEANKDSLQEICHQKHQQTLPFTKEQSLSHESKESHKISQLGQQNENKCLDNPQLYINSQQKTQEPLTQIFKIQKVTDSMPQIVKKMQYSQLPIIHIQYQQLQLPKENISSLIHNAVCYINSLLPNYTSCLVNQQQTKICLYVNGEWSLLIINFPLDQSNFAKIVANYLKTANIFSCLKILTGMPLRTLRDKNSKDNNKKLLKSIKHLLERTDKQSNYEEEVYVVSHFSKEINEILKVRYFLDEKKNTKTVVECRKTQPSNKDQCDTRTYQNCNYQGQIINEVTQFYLLKNPYYFKISIDKQITTYEIELTQCVLYIPEPYKYILYEEQAKNEYILVKETSEWLRFHNQKEHSKFLLIIEPDQQQTETKVIIATIGLPQGQQYIEKIKMIKYEQGSKAKGYNHGYENRNSLYLPVEREIVGRKKDNPKK